MKTRHTTAKFLLLAWCAVPLLALENEGPRRDHLKRLRGAIQGYGMLNPGKVPEKLSVLVDESLLDGPSSLVRPGGKDAMPPRAELDSRTDYTLEPLAGLADLVVREKSPLPGETEVLAIFKDGSIKVVPAPGVTGQAPARLPGGDIPRPPTGPTIEAARAPVRPPDIATPSVARAAPTLPTALPPPTASAVTPPPALVSGGRTGPAYLAEAETAFQAGRLAEARALFASASQLAPESTAAFIGLGRCANFGGDLDGAIAAYLNVARFAPETPNLRVWIAEGFIARGNFPSAQQWLDTELKVKPDSAWAWSWRGTLQLETGDRAAAAASMARATALQPETAAFRFRNGTALLGNNQPKRALMDFTAALMLDPRGTGAYYQLAECHARLGEREKAIENFRQYLQSDTTSEWAARARQRLDELSRPR